MNCEPLVSIIIPIFNVEKYLNKCIDSVLNQTYRQLEILLVDDGSTDSCGSICDWYEQSDQRIRCIHKIYRIIIVIDTVFFPIIHFMKAEINLAVILYRHLTYLLN